MEQRISQPKFGTPLMAKNCSICSTSTLLNQSTFPKTLFPWPLLPTTNSSVFSTLKNQKNQSLHLTVRFLISDTGTGTWYLILVPGYLILVPDTDTGYVYWYWYLNLVYVYESCYQYTQSVLIRNGSIRSTSDILGFFKK